MQPTISVIIPCFNGARFLRETLDSVVAQTFPPIEVIVVDDGSTDDSAAIAENYGPLVRVIRQANQGESVARNRGINESKGLYIFFLDADDVIWAESLEKLVSAVKHVPDGVALMGQAWFYDSPSDPFHVSYPPHSDFLSSIICDNPGAPHAWLTPRRLVEKIKGFTTDMTYCEDWDFWCRIAMAGGQLVTVPFLGARYRVRPESQSNSAGKDRYSLARSVVVSRLCGAILDDPDLVVVHVRQMFWSMWNVILEARRTTVHWDDLERPVSILQRIIEEQRDHLCDFRSARISRLLGIRRAVDTRLLLDRFTRGARRV